MRKPHETRLWDQSLIYNMSESNELKQSLDVDLDEYIPKYLNSQVSPIHNKTNRPFNFQKFEHQEELIDYVRSQQALVSLHSKGNYTDRGILPPYSKKNARRIYVLGAKQRERAFAQEREFAELWGPRKDNIKLIEHQLKQADPRRFQQSPKHSIANLDHQILLSPTRSQDDQQVEIRQIDYVFEPILKTKDKDFNPMIKFKSQRQRFDLKKVSSVDKFILNPVTSERKLSCLFPLDKSEHSSVKLRRPIIPPLNLKEKKSVDFYLKQGVSYSNTPRAKLESKKTLQKNEISSHSFQKTQNIVRSLYKKVMNQNS